MIDQYRNRLEAMQWELESLRSGRGGVSGDLLNGFLSHMEDNCRAIKSELDFQLDNCNMAQKVLALSEKRHPGFYRAAGLLGPSLKRSGLKLNEFLLFDFPEMLIPFHTFQGDMYWERKEYEKALAAWENVLKIDCGNGGVREKILKVRKAIQENDEDLTGTRSSPSLRDMAGRLIKDFQLVHVTSFRNNALILPTALVYSHRHQLLLAVDAKTNHIHKFTLQGKHLGSIFIEAGQLVGLLEDSDSNFWVCDVEHSRLIHFDIFGKWIGEMDIKKLCGHGTDVHRPNFGAFIDGRLFVVLTDACHQNRRLVTFENGKVSDLAVQNSQLVNDIKASDGHLFISCVVTGKLFRHDPVGGKLWTLRCPAAPILYTFAVTDDAIYLFGFDGQSILKIDFQGQVVFSLKRVKDCIRTSCQLHFATSAKIDGKWYLFVSDTNGRIHVLAV